MSNSKKLKKHSSVKISKEKIRQIVVLLDSNVAPKEIAKELDISESTVYRYKGKMKSGDVLNDLNTEDLQALEKLVTSKLLKTANKALDSIDEKKLNKSSAYQLAGIASIMVEKFRLSMNKSTGNLSVMSKHLAAIENREVLKKKKLPPKKLPDTQ